MDRLMQHRACLWRYCLAPSLPNDCIGYLNVSRDTLTVLTNFGLK